MNNPSTRNQVPRCVRVWRTGALLRETRRYVLLTVVCLGGLASTASAQVTRSFTEPYEQIEVSAAELGIIESIAVKVGDSVAAGQMLGQLNSGVLRESRRLASHRAQSTARVDAARADLQLKKKMFENLDPLLKSGHANPTEVERSRTEYEQALAAMAVANDEAIEAKIELARIDAQIAQRQIRSPINGVVINIHHKPGEYLPSNEPEFATVVDTSKLRARFFVATRFAVGLQKGDKLNVSIGGSHIKAVAEIEFVSPITDSESGTVRIDVVIGNRQQRLRSGIPCELADARFDRAATMTGVPRLNTIPRLER